MSNNFYTGVGSRETSAEILSLMERVASKLAKLGWVVRSGGADGADTAFLRGASGRYENYIPWKGFGLFPNGIIPDLAKCRDVLLNTSGINPMLNNRGTYEIQKYSGMSKLHCRNVCQVLGLTLDKPSKFCILYSKPNPNGSVSGGTNTAFMLCVHNNIPTFNLYDSEVVKRFEAFVSK